MLNIYFRSFGEDEGRVSREGTPQKGEEGKRGILEYVYYTEPGENYNSRF